MALKEVVDQVSGDSCWQKLSDQLGGFDVTKSRMLAELGKYKCIEESLPSGSGQIRNFSVQASETVPESKAYFAWDAPKSTREGSGPPGPVTNFRVIQEFPLPHLNSIIEILTKLGNRRLIDAARHYSPRFNNSIYRWSMSLYGMHERNLNKKGAIIVKLDNTNDAQSENITTQDLSELTLKDIEELSNLALPDATAFEELRISQPTIQSPGISFQVQLEVGSVLLEIAMLLTVIYFWIFYEEARVSSTFGAPGSLFAAFNRKPAARLIFNILIAVPGICSLILAIWLSVYSFSPYMKLTLIPALLTICLTLAILKSSLSISSHSVRAIITKVFGRTKANQITD
jgi:hypothetical protein